MTEAITGQIMKLAAGNGSSGSDRGNNRTDMPEVFHSVDTS